MPRALVATMSLAMFVIVGKALADDAGIWQFLLGGQRSGGYGAAPSAPALPPPLMLPPMFPRHAARPHIAKKPVVHLPIVRPKAIAHAELPKKVAATIYTDHTLRRGDSVMTARGLRVFKGSSHFPFRASDFVSLAEASRFVMGDKKQLRDIQLAFERIDVPATQFAALATGRSVSTAQAGTKTVDTADKTIRYVGP